MEKEHKKQKVNETISFLDSQESLSTKDKKQISMNVYEHFLTLSKKEKLQGEQ